MTNIIVKRNKFTPTNTFPPHKFLGEYYSPLQKRCDYLIFHNTRFELTSNDLIDFASVVTFSQPLHFWATTRESPLRYATSFFLLIFFLGTPSASIGKFDSIKSQTTKGLFHFEPANSMNDYNLT